MSSFYCTLNSDGSRAIHPNNHGGDFTVELHNTLDLVGAWEVALIEMTYFGQYFGNILNEYGAVSISSTKTAVYPTTFIVDYPDAANLYIEIRLLEIYLGKWYLHDILKFEKHRHYTWKGLKKAFKFLQSSKQTSVRFVVKKNTLAITPIYGDDVTIGMEVLFSPFLVNLLKLEKDRFQHMRKDEVKTIEVNIKKPEEIQDDSILLFTPDTVGRIWIKIGDDILIRIPKIYCTVKTFNKIALNSLFKFILGKEGNEWVMSVKYGGKKSYNESIKFSEAMQSALNVPHETMVYCGVDAGSIIGDIHPKRAPERNNAYNEVAFNLHFNYYPSSKSLVENLNSQCVDAMYKIAALQHSEQEFEKVFIHHEVGELVTYSAVDEFKVTISNHMLKVLNLPHTDYTNSGTKAINLPAAVRPFLHIHCNIIEPQLVNDDEYPLLRVINNNAAENEKVMVSFSQPQYYPTGRRYISSIHCYITDHVNLDPLIFTHPISYLLHFRRV